MDQLRKDLDLPRCPMGYLSAPMRHETALRRNQYRLQALGASAHLWEAGALHYCPHANSPVIGNSDVGYEAWMAMDISVLRRCDYIVMIGCWQQSAGCRRELALAMHLGLPVAYGVEDAIQVDKKLREKIA